MKKISTRTLLILLFISIFSFVGYYMWKTDGRFEGIERILKRSQETDSLRAILNFTRQQYTIDSVQLNDSIAKVSTSLAELSTKYSKDSTLYQSKKAELTAKLNRFKNRLDIAKNQITDLQTKLDKAENKAASLETTVNSLNILTVAEYDDEINKKIDKKEKGDRNGWITQTKANKVTHLDFYVPLSRSLGEMEKLSARLCQVGGRELDIYANIDEIDGNLVHITFDFPENTLTPGKYKSIIYFRNTNLNKDALVGETYSTDDFF